MRYGFFIFPLVVSGVLMPALRDFPSRVCGTNRLSARPGLPCAGILSAAREQHASATLPVLIAFFCDLALTAKELSFRPRVAVHRLF